MQPDRDQPKTQAPTGLSLVFVACAFVLSALLGPILS